MTISEESTTSINNINTLRDNNNSYKRAAPLATRNQSKAEILDLDNVEGTGRPHGNREIKGKGTAAEELSFRLPAGKEVEGERRFSISSFTSQSSSLFEEASDPPPPPPLADAAGKKSTTVTPKANKRLRIFQEIVETERRYCQDLEFIKVCREESTSSSPSSYQ